jgi:hypothetical protein
MPWNRAATWLAVDPRLAVQPVRLQRARARPPAWAPRLEQTEPRALPEQERWALRQEREQPPV